MTVKVELHAALKNRSDFVLCRFLMIPKSRIKLLSTANLMPDGIAGPDRMHLLPCKNLPIVSNLVRPAFLSVKRRRENKKVQEEKRSSQIWERSVLKSRFRDMRETPPGISGRDGVESVAGMVRNRQFSQKTLNEIPMILRNVSLLSTANAHLTSRTLYAVWCRCLLAGGPLSDI